MMQPFRHTWARFNKPYRMTSKYIAWILGAALVLVLGAFAFFWKSQEQAVLAPGTSDEAADTAKQAAPSGETEQAAMQAAKTAASALSLDDIAGNIGADMSDDQAALESEAAAELGSLEEGNAVVDDLGQTYDESEY